MTENRFFTWVWRFNGLAIAIAATLILGILVWELTRTWRAQLFPQQARGVLNVAEAETDAPNAEPVEETRRFGAPSDTATRGVYAMPLYVEQTYRNRGIYKDTGGNRVNFLIVDTRDQSQNWLFPAGPRLITESRALWYARKDGPNSFHGHLLHVIDVDTNSDDRLSQTDFGQLFHVSPDWKSLTPLAKDVSNILDVRTTAPESVDVIYTTATGTHVMQVDLPQAQVRTTLDLNKRP